MAWGDYDSAEWDNRSGISRRRRDSEQYQVGQLAEQQDFEEDWGDYDGRQLYYRSRPAPGPGRAREGERRAGMPYRRSRGERPEERRTMANEDYPRDRGNENQQGDWARQVRQNWQRGPYRDYGWEPGESVLPEFRDPSVHRTAYEEEEIREQYRRPRGRGPNFRRAYDYENARYLPTGEMPTQRGYGSGYAREEWWNVPGPYTGRGPRGYRRSDERISEDVCYRLTQHGGIDASDIEVHVNNGEVTLAGMVDSRQTKRMAEDAIESVAGVQDVHNGLRVRPQQNQQNQQNQQGSQAAGERQPSPSSAQGS